METEYPNLSKMHKQFICSQIKELKQNAERENIVGNDYERILDAFKATLEEAPRSEESKMTGELNDLKSGEFKDAALGLLPFLKVPKDWNESKQCTIEGMQGEVCRVRDCPKCAENHADNLKLLKREEESEITTRLARALAILSEAREGKDTAASEALAQCEEQVEKIRQEIEAIDGWFYGRKNANAVAWPPESVKHAYGSYGQPLCDKCKKYCLDYSTISANFDYVLNQASSEDKCFNGVRDKNRNNSGADGGGMRLDDFMRLKEAVDTNMTREILAALRFYTSHSFTAINQPLRDPDRTTQHPLPGITMNIQNGIRLLRSLDAEGALATQKLILWRGFTDMKVSKVFRAKGGTEFAPMSTTTMPDVAVGYAIRKGTTNGALLMKLKTNNNLQRGADLTWLSVFPGEAETLYPPLTFMQMEPTGSEQVIEHKGIKLTVVEVTTTLP